MKIETVKANKKGDFWIVNKDLENEFSAPINFSELLRGLEDKDLIDKYHSLNSWFARGNKAEKYQMSEYELLLKKKESIGNYLYKIYPMKKQNEDIQYGEYDKSAVIAISSQIETPISLDELTIEVVGATLEWFRNDADISADDFIKNYVSGKHELLKEHYGRLLEITIKKKWLKVCVDEGVLAIGEDRDPSYMNYPFYEENKS